jgi:serine/threonine protein kinase
LQKPPRESRIMKAELPTDIPYWNRISNKAKHLILQMLEANVDKRLKAVEIINNAWIRSHSAA